MTTTLPVPIAFELPDGWRATPPDGVGAPGAAFVALHPRPEAGFTANITVDGEFRPDAATLPEIADESVENLRRSAVSVEVGERREVGSPESPGLTQTLAVSAIAGGAPRDLVQSQVYLSLLDVDDPSRRAVIRLILTASASQHPAVVEDFREFVRTVRPDTGTAP
ncbi:hypothetical protein [Streptomyces sp. ALB3]|uniref:hypothetical protein n=1 Tax=Streptomyces sp. ALB3 TaxID=3374278 RepID=UPI00379E4FCC